MIIPRSLIADEVIQHKLGELMVKFLDSLIDTHKVTTDFLIDNNQKELDIAQDDERREVIRQNVETLKANQKNRITNASYYEAQISFLQGVLALKPTEFIEIDERIKELV